MSLNATDGYVIEQELHVERTIDTMTCHGRAREEFQLIEKQRFNIKKNRKVLKLIKNF